ncbi:MAG: dTDP-glucose 4,6-dehydratase [Elusimicrobia bacterium]|nr:dTDP-glucose 4,6-dehydratase [Elusimicrobiota bacterium]
MKLLVTGGAGFIGSNFVRFWLARHASDEVVNYDLLTYAGDRWSLADVEQNVGDRYRFEQGDIADASSVRRELEAHRPDVIVNFAAESHNSRAVLDPAAFARTNVLGTQVLLHEAKRAGVGRFHHISTCEVYGDLPLESSEAFTEASPYRPRTPYNASKAAADLVVRAFHETFGFPVTISNCSNNYGPFQFPEKVIPLFTTNALEDRPLPLYRQSQHRREWLHVDDHCRAIEAILERGRIGETYNVGSGDERSVEQIADAVLAELGKPRELKTYVEDRPGHDRRYLLDHSKITTELGWRPETPFAEGLASTVAWYVANRAWWAPKKRSIPDETAWVAPSITAAS